MYQGGCLCEGIQFSFDDIAGDYVVCHCRSCRKSSGSLGGINVAVSVDSFQLSDPKSLLATYESSNGKVRHFCKRCGSPLFTKVGENPAYVRVRLGAVDTDLEQTPRAHIFMDHRASWDSLNQDMLEYGEWPDLSVVDIRGTTKPK